MERCQEVVVKIKQIPIRVDIPTHQRLKKLSSSTRVPIQAYLREALAWLLKKYEA